MVETVVRKVKLPDNKTISIRVPSDWGSDRLEQELIKEGVLKPQRGAVAGFLSSVGEIPGAIPKGIEKGLEEAAHTYGDLREAIHEAVPVSKTLSLLGPTLADDFTKLLQGADVPEMGSESKGIVGKMTESVSQFATGAALSPIKGGGKLMNALQGAIGEFLAFNPEETNTLSTVLNEVPVLKGMIPDILVSDPDDTRWEGKAKLVLEGLGVGAAADTVIGALKNIKDGVSARLVREQADDTVPTPAEVPALPPPQKEFVVDSIGNTSINQSPNTTRREGIEAQAQQRRKNVGVARQQSDAAKVKELIEKDRTAAFEKIEAERAAAFEKIEAERAAIKKSQVDSAWEAMRDETASRHIDGLIRRSTRPAKFGQSGQVDPKVFREGIVELYRRTKNLLDFTREGKDKYGPHFSKASEAIYRSVRADLGELEEPSVKRTRVGGYNPNKMNTSEEVHQYTDELIRKFGESKEVKKWTDVRARASKIGMSTQQINRLRAESKNWTARVKAAEAAAIDSWEATQKFAVKALDGTPEDLQTFYHKMVEDAELLNSIAGIRSESGRLLNILKDVSSSRGDTTQLFSDFMESKGGLESLRSIAQKVSQAESVSAGRRITRKAMKEPTLMDAISEYWMNWGLLSGPQTHVTNFLSTGGFMGLSIPEMYGTSLIGKITRSSDAQSIAQAHKYAQGFMQAGKDAVTSARKTWSSDDAIIVAGNREIKDELGKIELEAHKAWRASTFSRYIPASIINNTPKATREKIGKLTDKSGEGVRLPGKSLYVGDAFWKTFGYRAKLNQLALDETERRIKLGIIKEKDAADTFQQIFDNPSKKIHDAAMENARELTMTRELEEFGKKVQAVFRNPYMKFAVPFVRVSTNIFKSSLERSPFGFAMAKVRENYAKGGRSRDEVLSKMLIGSAISATAFEMFEGGVLTGAAPKDPESAMNFYESKRIPFAAKVGDEWVHVGRMEPFATLMGTGAVTAQAWDYMSEGEKEKAAVAFAAGMGEMIANKTFMESLGSIIQAITDYERYGSKWLHNTLSSLAVPNLSAQIARDIDPHLKEIETILDAVNQRTPWNRDEVVNKLNRWGEEIEYGGNMVNPFWDSQATESKFLNAMYKNDIQVGMPSQRIFGVGLSPKLYNQYVKFARIPARRQLEKMYNTTNISSLSPEMQEKRVQAVIKKWDNFGRQRMFPLIKEAVIKNKLQRTRALFTPEKEEIDIKAE